MPLQLWGAPETKTFLTILIFGLGCQEISCTFFVALKSSEQKQFASLTAIFASMSDDQQPMNTCVRVMLMHTHVIHSDKVGVCIIWLIQNLCMNLYSDQECFCLLIFKVKVVALKPIYIFAMKQSFTAYMYIYMYTLNVVVLLIVLCIKAPPTLYQQYMY